MTRVHNRSSDIAVVGGGIVGLWTAFEAARQGRNVVLIEKRTIGSGASGGFLGALMPHQPTDWNPKKQFQLDGLLTIEDEIAVLEDLTGLSAGFRRCGRLMPIRSADNRRQCEQRAAASHDYWPYPLHWEVAEATIHRDLLPPHEMPFGVNADTLSARLDPRALIAVLRAALEISGATVREMTEIAGFAADGEIRFADGATLSAGSTILAAGWETFGLIDPLCAGPGGQGVGQGVKGQAALLRPAGPVDPASPILYDDGVYVIVHENGLVAVGSTSEDSFDDPASTDGRLDDVIARARAVSPVLADAEIVERWAGVRPKAAGREPVVGPIPGQDNLLIATGGFKISFAIAHLMARAALAMADGEVPPFLPGAFHPQGRLSPRGS